EPACLCEHRPQHRSVSAHVSVQTSLLVLQRKTAEEIAVETAAGRINDYDVFLGLANHIGHDKRGNITYVRDSQGNEIVEEAEGDFLFTRHYPFDQVALSDLAGT